MSARAKSRPSARIPPGERAGAEWARRVEAEYRSAAITQQLTLWLIQIGASPDLIRAGLRIAGDELAHAELSHRVARACGGAPFVIAREQLGIARRDGEPLESDVTRACVSGYCLGETVAVPLFSALRARCVVPVARRALDRVLRDEVRHREFGWTLLGWLLATPGGAELRALAERELPSMFAALRDSYGREFDDQPCSDADRAWGLMAARGYRDVLLRSVERDFVPRFARLGIDARRAWRLTSA